MEFLARQFIFLCVRADAVQLQKLRKFAELVESEFIADLGYFLKQAAFAVESKTMAVSCIVTRLG